MLIRLGYDIQFEIDAPVPIVVMLKVHPSRRHDLQELDSMQVEPAVATTEYADLFGNICARFVAPGGRLRLSSSAVIFDSGEPDVVNPDAAELPVAELPAEALRFLLPSRFCEVDLLSNTAVELFGGIPRGWPRVQAICDWVHDKVTFSYPQARQTRTALDVYTERVGVCRDFQHLAITFCRALNIPARYVTGYLGDIGIPPTPSPMDFSAWFEVFLDGRWWTFDARHDRPRIGRVVIATGLDATDVAITTSFGRARLAHFSVTTDEVVMETAGEATRT